MRWCERSRRPRSRRCRGAGRPDARPRPPPRHFVAARPGAGVCRMLHDGAGDLRHLAWRIPAKPPGFGPPTAAARRLHMGRSHENDHDYPRPVSRPRHHHRHRARAVRRAARRRRRGAPDGHGHGQRVGARGGRRSQHRPRLHPADGDEPARRIGDLQQLRAAPARVHLRHHRSRAVHRHGAVAHRQGDALLRRRGDQGAGRGAAALLPRAAGVVGYGHTIDSSGTGGGGGLVGAGAFATACLREDCSSLANASATYQLAFADGASGTGHMVVYGGSIVHRVTPHVKLLGEVTSATVPTTASSTTRPARWSATASASTTLRSPATSAS